MKKYFGIFIGAVFICILSVLFCIGCSASDNKGTGGTGERVPIISYGLNVLSHKKDMRVAAIKGESFTFSKTNFQSAMNLSDIESIQITRLPDGVCGTLYYNSQPIKAGQTVSGADIGKITFTATQSMGEYASFDFRVNGTAYENECKIFALSKVNSSPSTDNASYASLNIETHKNINTFGVLSGHDAEGDDITYEIVSYPEGVLKMLDEKHGTYTYIPKENFSGKDSFEYVVRDKYGNYSASEKVSVVVSTPSVSVFYSDLENTDLHTYAIDLTEEGIMNGVQVGEHFYFKPEGDVSRAEFVVTAMNALGIKSVPNVENTGFFDDGKIRPEMKGYIALAYSKGYISGIKKDGEIYFEPDESISLSEASVILSNIIGYKEPSIKPVFSDGDSIPSWSERAVVSLHSLGVIESNDGSIDAAQTITRGSMAKLLSRAMFITEN